MIARRSTFTDIFGDLAEYMCDADCRPRRFWTWLRDRTDARLGVAPKPAGIFSEYPPRPFRDYVMDLDLAAAGIEQIKAGAEIGATTSVLLAGLLLHNGPADVLDYGGGLGSVYFRLRRIATERINSWSVVELPAVVDYGKRFEDDRLWFSAVPLPHPDILVLGGVLQYLPAPCETMAALLALRPRIVVLDRTPIGPRGRHMVQHTWPHLGGHELSYQVLDRARVDILMAGYDLLLEQSTDHPGPDETEARMVARIYRLRP